MSDALFHGYAHVLALPAKLDEALRIASRQSRIRKTTVYVGEKRSSRVYVVWKHIPTHEVDKLTYDLKLKTMPWLDLREMSKPYEYKFEYSGGRRGPRP